MNLPVSLSCVLAHRPGDAAAHAALCLPRRDWAVGFWESGDGSGARLRPRPVTVFPPKRPAVATRGSCRGSRTNLSCRWKLRKGVSGLYFGEPDRWRTEKRWRNQRLHLGEGAPGSLHLLASERIKRLQIPSPLSSYVSRSYKVLFGKCCAHF